MLHSAPSLGRRLAKGGLRRSLQLGERLGAGAFGHELKGRLDRDLRRELHTRGAGVAGAC